MRDPTAVVSDPAYQSAIRAVRDALAKLPFVRAVESVLDGRPEHVSGDGHATYLTIRTSGDPEEVQAHLAELRQTFAASPVPAWLTGLPVVSEELSLASERDLVRAELITLPLVLVVLLVVFRTVVAAAIPLALGFMSVTVSLAALYGVSFGMELSVFVTNIATILGLGIGIDYSLLMVSRFREELRSKPVAAAVEATVARAGKAVVFSGVAVAIGMSGLLLFEMTALRSMGVGGIVVVLLLVLGALTLVPAVLGIVGTRIDALAVPLRRRPGEGQRWARIAWFVMRRPVLVLTLTVALLVVLGLPFARVRFGVPGADVLPAAAPARTGAEVLRASFQRGAMPAILVTVTDPSGILRAPNVAALEALTAIVQRSPEVASVTSLTTLFPGVGRAQLEALVATRFASLPEEVRRRLGALVTETTTLIVGESLSGANNEGLQAVVRELRAAPASGLEVHVGGEVAVLLDFVQAVYGSFPWTIALILGVTYVTLFFLFGSVLLPLKPVVMNGLSITAAYGALVFIFQDGNLSNVLGFQSRGIVDATVPVLMFCTLFGLSMDYEVFLLTRIREAWQRSGDNQGSVAEGLQRTGDIITGAAAILIVVTGAFAFADIIVVKALGVSTAVAILVDATVVRALLVPATMRLLGAWNWWAPRSLQRLTRVTSSFAE
ncbi:MAG: MMPL family transporter [Actinobacteria bacterium]|nr:MMPL family transporter [Actinomycetota bacterium]